MMRAMEHKNAVGVVLMRGNLVQLCERLPGASGRHVGCWGGTGGLCEPGELSPEAAARETKEECGVEAHSSRFILLHQNDDRTDSFTYTARHYLLRLEPGETLERKQPLKHGPWVDMTPNLALTLRLVPGLADAIREMMRRGL